MEPKSVSDQFIESLKNEDVVAAAVGKAMASFIALAVEETIKKSMQLINKSIQDLSIEFRNISHKVKHLEDVNSDLKKRLVSVQERVEVMERESRRSNMII